MRATRLHPIYKTINNSVETLGGCTLSQSMAWRIGNNVVRGEIDNRTPGRVDGKVWLAGRSDPLILQLSGNCHKDLAGRKIKITFWNPAMPPDPSLALVSDQSGVVGEMTASRKVRVSEHFDCLGSGEHKPASERIANCLYLEWFSGANGRVVIESTEHDIQVSEPVWTISPEEEVQQHQANAEAMRTFVERAAGVPDPREEAAYGGAPKDEFEWELFLRASDRRVTKLGELMEKYHDHPDGDRITAREMGWSAIEEMLDAEAEFGLEEETETDHIDDIAEAEPEAAETDPLRHPLVERLLERSTTLMKLAGKQQDDDLDEMVGAFITVGPKVAGSLGILRPGRNPENHLNGLVIARLKRALGELSRALNAADRLRKKNAELPFSIEEWIAEMLEIRQKILSLMTECRCP